MERDVDVVSALNERERSRRHLRQKEDHRVQSTLDIRPAGYKAISVIRPIFNSKANNNNRDFLFHFVGYKATELCYKGNVGYKAKIREN